MQEQPPDDAVRLIVLIDASTDIERDLVTDWMRRAEVAPALVLPLSGSEPAQALAGAEPESLVIAARVGWLPRELDGQRRVRWADVVSMVNPRRPPLRAQARILRLEPDRAAVVVAEPATVAALRDRFPGPDGDAPAFGAFVARQATLALDRAERALLGDRFKVPRHVVEAVEGSPEFRRDVAELAAKLDRSVGEVAAKVTADLDGLVASMSPVAVDLLSAALRPLHARAWDVQVDTSGLRRLRELNRRFPLVFLPSHRSYADPLLLADVLAEHDFPRNHVLGGDNLRFWPVGPLAKRAGVVFIRRSFGDDEIYKLAVREYFGFLLAKRFNLEWYLEGGRSRTGKLRPPRYGLLAGVAEALDDRRCEDVFLVPVSIAYDQLREAAAMAAEQRGAKKQAEGLGWLLAYARAQLSQIGTAHVRFAEPISLRAALGVGVGDPAGRRLALQKAAFEVSVGINRVTPVMATALVTLALLGVRDRALTLPQVRRVLEPVRGYVIERGLPHSIDLLGTADGVLRVLAALTAENVVTTYAGGDEPVYAIERGHHLVAAFYRNSAIHHFVDRAIAELMALCAPCHRLDEAARLRDLLKFEFFFPDRETHHAQLSAELGRMNPDWETVDGRDVLRGAGFRIAHRVLRSFLDAQLVVAERLAARDPSAPVVEREFLDECGGVGQQMLLQGRLHGPESLSRELFGSALKLAANQELVDARVDRQGDDLALRRQAFAAQLRDVVRKVIEIDEIDAATRREVAGVEP
ncbi:MAG: glycerol-3-phosphate 1-O-acyltransferase [Pseudonocardia sp.]